MNYWDAQAMMEDTVISILKGESLYDTDCIYRINQMRFWWNIHIIFAVPFTMSGSFPLLDIGMANIWS
jgi:hypothetical protein